MQDNVMPSKRRRRMFRVMVWSGRALGWALMLVAIFGVVQAELLPRSTYSFGFSMVSSLGLGLVAGAWIIALEVFLRFFDQYLSRN
jgi:uncharacterized membrane protein